MNKLLKYESVKDHPRYKKFMRGLTFICALLFFVIGALGLYKSVSSVTFWKPVNATIKISSITHDCTTLSSFGRTRRSYEERELSCNRQYNPNIQYEYQVDGKDYKNSQVSFGEINFATKEEAEKWMQDKKLGNKIKIFYDPTNPGASIIQPGINWWALLIFIVSICVMIGCVKEKIYQKQNVDW